MKERADIVIAGAGIGGLTAALALARRGIAVRLVERAGRLSEVGAGIQIPPNAARVLIALGLERALERSAVAPDALAVRSGRTGAALQTMPLGSAMGARFGAPYWVIHRADLQQALLAAVRVEARIALELGREVTGFEPRPGGDGIAVAVRGARAGAAILPARALVGADGVRSVLRLRLGGARPAFSGYVAWRGTIPADAVPAGVARGSVGLWLGASAHLVHYPLRRGSLVNVVAIVSGAEIAPGWGEVAPAGELTPRFDGWARPARALVGAVRDWLRWPLAVAGPLARWSAGPVTLLGDAAHPTLPFLAQGGAMAIEDAAVLADSLAAAPDDPATAFARYEALRRPRAARLQRAAQRNGRIFHLDGALRIARDAALRLMPPETFARRQAWIYDWRP